MGMTCRWNAAVLGGQSALIAALLVLAAAPANGSEFSERLAAWQGGANPVRRAQHEAPAQGTESAAMAGDSSYATTEEGTIVAGGPTYFDEYAQGGGCGEHGCCDAGCYGPMMWMRFELLLWWHKGRDLPALVTTDPIGEDSTTAGILPGAEVLIGDEEKDSELTAGGRFDIGYWLDADRCFGIGDRFFALGDEELRLRADSTDEPVLAIPFFDARDDANNALLVAFPGLRSGQINVRGDTSVLGNDVYARMLVCQGSGSRLDFVTGYHYSRINDDLRIRTRTNINEVGGSIPFGTRTRVSDDYQTSNSFHGAILGFLYEAECDCWTMQGLARVSLGNMSETARIDGSTRLTAPGLPPQSTQGGLFTSGDSRGSFSRNEFSTVSEVGLRLGYRWGPCTQLSLGYSFIHWNDVLRASDQINTRVGAVGDQQFRLTGSDFWVQGINVGLVREF